VNISLKDVPASLHERLREEAVRSGRSLNKLILHTLEKAVVPRTIDRNALVERIRRRRDWSEVWLDDELLGAAIRDGRS
jgi:hypothetical protein